MEKDVGDNREPCYVAKREERDLIGLFGLFRRTSPGMPARDNWHAINGNRRVHIRTILPSASAP